MGLRSPPPETKTVPPIILVSGNDTGIGKTVACASLARRFDSLGPSLYLKPIETGVVEPVDAVRVSAVAENLETRTLFRFREPLAPAEAARIEGKEVDFLAVVNKARSLLNNTHSFLVEGAGGLASPIDEKGRDWLDFAEALPADFLVLVVENRLGVLNQARLLASRLQDCSIPCGLWLNEIHLQDEATLTANSRALARESLPIWARQCHGASEPVEANFPWEKK